MSHGVHVQQGVSTPKSEPQPGGEPVAEGGADQTQFSSGGAIPPVGTGHRDPKTTASEHAYGDNPKVASPVSHLLEVSPDRVMFPSVQIGQSAKATVELRNADDQVHALDPAIPVTGDPFSDFVVEQTGSLVLPPGESRPLTLRFEPSRAISDQQTFQLDTDNGLGPSGEVRLSGTGHDQAGSAARVADQDFQRDNIEADRKNDPLRKSRVLAERAIHEWAATARAHNVTYADWSRNNVETFLGKTGGDVHYVGPSLVRRLVTKGLAKGIGKALEVETENPVVDKVAEKVTEKFADYVAEKLIGGEEKPEPEESALEATEHMAQQSNAAGGNVATARSEADAVIQDSESGALLRIAQATNAADIERWRYWGVSQKNELPAAKKASDRELADELLVEWVKQRAGTPTTAGSATNTTAWSKARRELAESGKLATTEIPNLFVSQCRYEWMRIGLDDAEIEAAVVRLDARRKEAEDEARRAGADPQAVALHVVHELGRDGSAPMVAWFHHSSNSQQTAAVFAALDRQFEVGAGGAKSIQGSVRSDV